MPFFSWLRKARNLSSVFQNNYHIYCLCNQPHNNSQFNHQTLPALESPPFPISNCSWLLHPVALTESPFIHFSLTAWLFFKKEKFTTYPLDYIALNLTILLTFLGLTQFPWQTHCFSLPVQCPASWALNFAIIDPCNDFIITLSSGCHCLGSPKLIQ